MYHSARAPYLHLPSTLNDLKAVDDGVVGIRNKGGNFRAIANVDVTTSVSSV